jgi:tocopherol O-methyltransferase
MDTAITDKDIINYYDSCQIDYELVWHLKSRMSMHYGYWDETTKNLRQSLTNMNVKLAEMAGISINDFVLDAGCGVGGSSIFLAKNIGCQVKGITLSAKQVETARLNARKNGVEGKVEFEVNNFCSTHYSDESFDVIWAIESVCHASEKADFLKEAYRLLKNGGRLILADFFSNSFNHSIDKENMLSKWAATWAVPEFENVKTFEEKSFKAGFKEVIVVDATKNIAPSAVRLYLAFYPGIVCDRILRLIGKRNSTQYANVWSTFYQYHSLKKGLWSYQIIKAVK